MKKLITLLPFALFTVLLSAQENKAALRLYIDCSFCSQDYLRQHLPYLEYVRSRQLADVHLIASRWPTAASGYEVQFELIGQGRFAGEGDSLRFILPLGVSENQQNEKLAAELEKALLPFLARTSFRQYNDTTIYNQIREGFLAFDLQAALELKEQWGEASTHIEVASFLNAPSRYQLNLWAGISLNLFQGLTLNLDCDASFIRNQVGLPQSGLTTEEVLLQQRQQATNFRLATSLGFSYTFGSIYNNVVNPRFGY